MQIANVQEWINEVRAMAKFVLKRRQIARNVTSQAQISAVSSFKLRGSRQQVAVSVGIELQCATTGLVSAVSGCKYSRASIQL